MQRAHAMGLRIPDDLSIVGFDDGDLRYRTWPVLSAVCQDAAQLGFEAALWLTRKLAGVVHEPLRKEMSTFFEVHETTGLPPATPVRVLPSGQRVVANGNGNGNGNGQSDDAAAE